MGTHKKTNRSLARKWTRIIKDYNQRGQTQAKYSKLNGFPSHQLVYWIRRLEKKTRVVIDKKLPSFISVQLEAPPNSNKQPYCQLSFDNGGVIAVENKSGFSKLCELISAD
jgi:transposase-like protein